VPQEVAGLLYLLVAITCAFSIMYIPSTFVVPGNATATAGRIAASLVFKSGFLPRFLGVLLIVAGLAYLASSFTLLLFPNQGRAISQLMLVPEGIGELSIAFWLLIKGASAQPLESLGR
jgi:Domain of unknown function (DUF4386)